MRIIKNEKTQKYHLIEIQYSFLWFKWSEKYIKVKENIFGFNSPDNYYIIGHFKQSELEDIFESASILFNLNK